MREAALDPEISDRPGLLDGFHEPGVPFPVIAEAFVCADMIELPIQVLMLYDALVMKHEASNLEVLAPVVVYPGTTCVQRSS
jgi:hypothetical protein